MLVSPYDLEVVVPNGIIISALGGILLSYLSYN